MIGEKEDGTPLRCRGVCDDVIEAWGEVQKAVAARVGIRRLRALALRRMNDKRTPEDPAAGEE